MSMYFYPEHTGSLELHVDNPGYGELHLSADPDQDGELWTRSLAGAALGALLNQVTSLALTAQPPAGRERVLPLWFGPEHARHALPAVQQAVLLAGCGTDRYERLLPEPDEPPAEPLCERCDEGTYFSSGATVSDWCAEHGHTPFGFTSRTNWEQAHQRHAERLRRWQTMHRPEWQPLEQRLADLHQDGDQA